MSHPLLIADTWKRKGISSKKIKRTADWLGAARDLDSQSLFFFRQAGKILLHARYDFELTGPAFSHAVIGFEACLRGYYHSIGEHEATPPDPPSTPLGNLFRKIVEEGVLTDKAFQNQIELSEDLRALMPDCPDQDEPPDSYSQTLACLIPELRNLYFHGQRLAMWELLPLSRNLREAADRLKAAQDSRPADGCPKAHHATSPKRASSPKLALHLRQSSS